MKSPKAFHPLSAGLAAAALVAGGAGSVFAGEIEPHPLSKMAPYRGYLDAHQKLEDPQPLLGGPVTVSLEEEGGTVFIILPSKRKLDPNVFGTPEMPRAFGGTPGINGAPLTARETEGGKYTTFSNPNPFGDRYTTMGSSKLSIEAIDATATDAATTNDRVRMTASWQDADGNTYEVRCCDMMAAHGVEFPTFGGVVTNHILHGSSRLGTSLMPTEYTYFAFWGMGAVLKNGEVLQKPRLVHGMLTEYVRGVGNYELALDEQVDPTRKHFHLMVPPMKPVQEPYGHFQHVDVNTGLEIEMGGHTMTLPFWHVMFETVEVSATR